MKNDKLIRTAGTMDQIVKICSGFFKAFVIVLLVFRMLVLILGDRRRGLPCVGTRLAEGTLQEPVSR